MKESSSHGSCAGAVFSCVAPCETLAVVAIYRLVGTMVNRPKLVCLKLITH